MFGYELDTDLLPDIGLPDIELPSIPNPMDYLPSMPAIPNPLDYLPPDPLGPVAEDLGKRINKGIGIHDAVVNGEANTTTPTGVADPKTQSLKQKYQQQSYANLGIDQATFDTMDPIKRNGLINAAYAKMYKKDPEVYKWAGMAAMASDKAGTGMMQTYMLDGAETVPGVDQVPGAVGAPGGKEVRDLLAIGNGGIYNDMMWQHLAFDQGGMKAMQDAFKEKSISQSELDAWQKLADNKEALAKAKASGDSDALKKAQDGIWAGNGSLLRSEQENVQKIVYDKPGADQAFEFLSGPLNVMGVSSPIPGGTKFGDYRDEYGSSMPGPNNVSHMDQRWDWIEKKMIPEYQKFEGDPSKMDAEMNKYIGRENKNQWDEKAWDPLNEIAKKAGGPVYSPFLDMF